MYSGYSSSKNQRMDIVCTWRRKDVVNIYKQTIKGNFKAFSKSNKWYHLRDWTWGWTLHWQLMYRLRKGKIKKKLLLERFPYMDIESKSGSEFKQSRWSLEQLGNSFYSWSFFYRRRRSFPFRKRSLPFSRHLENSWPVIESVPIKKKENRNPESNPDPCASPNLSPLPLHYQNEPPKIPEKL